MIWTKESLLQALENAPTVTPAMESAVPDLLGWACSVVNICKQCSSKLWSRGFSMGSDSHSIWVDSESAEYKCSGCGRKFGGKAKKDLTAEVVSE